MVILEVDKNWTDWHEAVKTPGERKLKYVCLKDILAHLKKFAKWAKWNIANIFLQLCLSLELSLVSEKKQQLSWSILILSLKIKKKKKNAVCSMQDFTVIRLLRYTDSGLTKNYVPVEDLNIQSAKLAKTK